MDGSSKKLISNELAHFYFSMGILLIVVVVLAIGYFLYKTFALLRSLYSSTPSTHPPISEEESVIEITKPSENTPPYDLPSPPRSPPLSHSYEDRIRTLIEERDRLMQQVKYDIPNSLSKLRKKGPQNMNPGEWQNSIEIVVRQQNVLSKRLVHIEDELKTMNYQS
jgi:hypothetical protein